MPRLSEIGDAASRQTATALSILSSEISCPTRASPARFHKSAMERRHRSQSCSTHLLSSTAMATPAPATAISISVLGITSGTHLFALDGVGTDTPSKIPCSRHFAPPPLQNPPPEADDHLLCSQYHKRPAAIRAGILFPAGDALQRFPHIVALPELAEPIKSAASSKPGNSSFKFLMFLHLSASVSRPLCISLDR